MSWIRTPPEGEAGDAVTAAYDRDRATLGYVANYTRVFAHRPAVYDGWRSLNGAIKASMDPRRYELATDPSAAPLSEVDRAVLRLADKVAAGAAHMTEADLADLRDLGVDDAEILDVVLAAAARCFFSSVLDAVGAEPDAVYRSLDPDVRAALTVGRRIAEA